MGIKKMMLLVSLMLAVISHQSMADTPNAPSDEGVVRGVIFDGKTKVPIEYATVAIYNKSDDSVVTGTITDDKGEFRIKGLDPGEFYIVVSFLGYENKRFDDIVVAEKRDVIDLGKINLGTGSTNIEEIEVVSERQSVEYKIDKKVVSVGKQMTSASLSAVEVLQNVPSIRVDIEGNVSLRGSTGFTVLIDGKPTVMEPSDVLRQIPASTIENIEIITNPSAKYQPDGTGGIINVITKKNRTPGLQGLFNLKTGSFGMYGGDFLLNYRQNKINFNLGADYNERPFPGTTYNERRTWDDAGNETLVTAHGTDQREFRMYGLRGGFDWDISDHDLFSFGFRLGNFKMDNSSDLDYLTTTQGEDDLLELSINESGRGGDYYSLTTNYTHRFEQKGHELSAQLNYRYRQGDESSQNQLINESTNNTTGTKTAEFGPSGRWELRLDYTKPVGEEGRFEAGFQGRSDLSEDETELYFYENGNGFVIRPQYGNLTEYDRKIMALYSTLNGSLGKLGYQFGLRGEYTYREITTRRDDQSFNIDRWDIFPTLHFSYELPKENQLMASYSRRIDRPRGWFLEPFVTYMDMFNVRMGNPDLKPEYIDALEAGYLKRWDKSQFSLEGYYRIKHNKIDRIQSVWEEGDALPDGSQEIILMHTMANVGTDYSLGAELSYNTELFKWWEINLMGDMFDYRLKGVKNDMPFERSSFNWSSRFSNTFRLKKNMQLQFDGNYNSATVTTQGKNEAMYMFNAAYRVDLFDRKVTAVVQVGDMFRTARFVSISEDDQFYSYQKRRRDAPNFSFTLSYKLNNFMQKRGRRGGDEGGDSMDGEF